MTPAFQSAIAELVLRGRAEPRPLSPLEQRRVDDVAGQDGVRVMWTLYCSWRLTKVLSLLPLTSALLGEQRLGEMLRRYWKGHRATTLYFVEECLDFLGFLREELDETPPRFADVVAFESARLELRAEQSRGCQPGPRHIVVSCELDALVDSLQAGGDPAAIPDRRHQLRGELDIDGEERWVVVAVEAEAG